MNVDLNPKHPMYTANDFYRQKFGEKLIKLAVDGGFTCPNRDGRLSFDGCIFCSEKGSGDFAVGKTADDGIAQQIENAKGLLNDKWKNGKYMVYFQSFTNTYAPVEYLKKLYFDAIKQQDVVAIAVATRPDCINDEVVALFKEINKTHYVQVELGLQTSNEITAKKINRCYKNSVYQRAVEMLNSADIDTVTHIILGLPWDTVEDMKNSVNFAVNAGTKGLKLQLLHVLKGTKLGEMYEKKPFKTFEKQEYINLVADIVENLPQNIVIHRVTGDAPKKLLIEPWWSLDKRSVLNGISKEFVKRKSQQGIHL